jgi:hypothetical protein
MKQTFRHFAETLQVGDRHLKFYEPRDNLVAYPQAV